MVDLEKLDKKTTYVGLQYGKGLISKQIIKLTKSFAPKSKNIPSHVLGLKFRYGKWWIFESHAKGDKKLGVPAGVRRYKQDIWAKLEPENNFKIFPMKLRPSKLEEYIGQCYGTGDIESLMMACLFKTNGKQKDRKGLICSEYMALCNEEICEYYNLPAYCLTPAHFQNYFDMNKIKAVI